MISDPRRARRLPSFLGLTAWTLLLTVATVLGRASRADETQLALVWPAAGVSVLWLLTTATRRDRWQAVGAMTAVTALGNVVTGTGVTPSVLLALVNAVHAVLGAAVLRRGGWTSVRPAANGRDVVLLLGASAGASLASAALGGLVAWLSFGGSFRDGAGLLLVRNTVSTFVLVAVLASLPALGDRRARAAGTASGPERVVSAAATLVLSGLIMQSDGSPVSFLLLPATVWVAVRCGTALTAAVVGGQSVLVVVSTVLGHGPFVGTASAAGQALLAQAFLGVLVLVGLCLSLTEQERDRALAGSRADHARLRAHLDAALIAHATLVVEPDGVRVLGGNPALTRLLGRESWRASCRDVLSLVHEAHRPRVREALQDLSAGRAAGWSGEFLLTGADGPVWVQAALGVSTETVADGTDVHVTAQLLDISARKRAEAQLEHLALHDDLTGLPNRVLWRERLGEHLTVARECGERVGVLYLDLDGFKAVNDTYGHAAGDALLVEVGERLRNTTRSGDTVARIGGDEFLVACPDVGDGVALEALAQRLVQAVSPDVLVDGRRLSVTVSIGGVLCDGDEDVDVLVRRADAALYRAKDGGRGRAEVLRQR